MLLINFICIFYLMVLVRCDTISNSETNTEPYDGVTYPYKVVYSRQDASDPDYRTSERSHQISQRRPWITVPSGDYSTAGLEEVLKKLKHRNLKQIASSPFAADGLVFATEFGYGTMMQNSGFSTHTPKNLNRNPENKHRNDNTLDETTEFDETDYLDNLRIQEAINKPRTVKEAKKEEKKKKEKCKFKFRDLFKFLHPKKKKCDPKTEGQSKKLLDQVPVLSKKELKSEKKNTAVTSTAIIITSKVTDKSGSKKLNAAQKKNNRHRRTVDQNNDATSKQDNFKTVSSTQKYYNQKWLPNFRKREPTPADSSTYEALSNQLSYKDFVDGFKYYLKFERDMARTNFSDMVRYQAHKHHNVDDIGKFILEKIPQIPVTESYNSTYESPELSPEFEEKTNTVRNGKLAQKERLDVNTESDSDVRLEKYGSTQRPTFPTSRRFDSLKKRLIEVQKPSWLHKKPISSYFDSKTRSPRIRRGLKPRIQNTIRFYTTEFPQSLKSDTAKLKDPTKNVAFAKVNLVETAKTKKPFRGFFAKLKKHKAKRDASGILKKLRQIFSNGQSSTARPKGLTVKYRYPSNLYDAMNIKYPMYKAPEMTEDLDVMIEKFKKPVSQTSTTLSYLDYYDTVPNNAMFSDPDVHFELTTLPVKNKMLQKKLNTLQKEYDIVAARSFESEYEANNKMNPTRTTPDGFYKLTALREAVTLVAHKAGSRTKPVPATSKYSTSTVKDLEYEDFQDLLGLSQKQGQHLTNGYNKPATPKSNNPIHHYTISWQINDSDLANKKQDYDPEDKSVLTSAPEIPAGAKVEDNTVNRVSVKPSMLNNFDESIKLKARIDTNRLKTKTTRRVKSTNVGFYNKQLKPAVKALPGNYNNDVVMIHTSTMLMATDKDTNEGNGRNNNNKDYIKINKDRVSTSDRFRGAGKGIHIDSDTEEVENGRITSKDTQTVSEDKSLPIHNKLMYGTVIGQKHVANAKKAAMASAGNHQPLVALKYPASKLDANEQKKNDKKKLKTKPAALMATAWNVDSPDIQFKYEDEDKRTYQEKKTDRTKQTTFKFDFSNMVDRFHHDFPEFDKIGKSTTNMKNIHEWLEKHYSDTINIGEITNSKEKAKFETSTVGRLNKDGWDKHNIDYGKTTTKSLNKQNKLSCDIKKKPGIQGKTAKDVNKQTIKKSTLADKTEKKVETTVAGVDKQETTAAAAGRIVKDWLKTTIKIINSDKNGKTAREMAINFSDDLNNVANEKGTTSAYKNKKIATFRHANDFAARVPELDKHYYYSKKIGSTDNYNFLFKEVPNSKEKNNGNGRLVYNQNFSKKYFPVGELNSVNTKTHASELSNYDNEIRKDADDNLASKYKGPEHNVHPEQVEIVQTYDIIYAAHGNMPFTNRSLNHVHTLLKEISNLKKRNLRKSNRGLFLKTFKANKSRRRKRFTGVSERRNQETNNKVYYNDNTNQDGEIRVQKRKRQSVREDLKNVALKDPVLVLCGAIPKAMAHGTYILLVNCSATLPRGNYLLKPLGEGALSNVVAKTHRIDNRNVTSIPSDELNKLRESDERKDENTGHRRRRADNWKAIKNWFHGARTCTCKCKPHKTMCPACAASDAVMTDVIFRLGNIISFVNEHSTEIEEYFKVNPSGAAEFRNALKETDKCLKNYSKRAKGQCVGKPCEAFKLVQDKDDNYKDVT